jgi:hypothetical protein
MLCKFERNSKKKMMIRAATIGTHHSQCQQEGNGRSLQFQNVAASCGQLHIHMGIMLTIAGRCEGTVFGSNPGVRVRAFSKAV